MDNDPVYFVFEPDSAATPVTWKIRLQQDQGTIGGLLPIEQTTWGAVKALYR